MDQVTSDGWEPDALTAQVRFWEGFAAQWSMERIL